MTEQQNNAQFIAKVFMSAGCTLAGAAGAIGNFESEAGLYPCRVQGDYDYPFEASELYARQVMSGAISEKQWMYDGRGWGLPQFTYWSLKKGFLDYCKAHGTYIWKIEAQCAYMIQLFKTEYASLWQTLCTTSSARAAAVAVMLQFERPADQSMSAQNYRSNLADKWLGWLTANGTEPETEPVQDDPEPETPETEYWPPRTIDKTMSGQDVAVLQAVLMARGYYTAGIDSYFGDTTEEATLQFQRDNNLVQDGIVGRKTWTALFTM